MNDDIVPSADAYWLDSDRLRFWALKDGKVFALSECEQMNVVWSQPDRSRFDDWTSSDA